MVAFVGLGFGRKMNLLWTNICRRCDSFGHLLQVWFEERPNHLVMKNHHCLGTLEIFPQERFTRENPILWSEYPLHLHNFVWFSVAIGTLARNFVSQFRCRIAYQLRIQTYRIVHKISQNLSRQTEFFSPFLPPFSPTNRNIDATDGALPVGSSLFSRNGMIYSEDGRHTLGSSQSTTCN